MNASTFIKELLGLLGLFTTLYLWSLIGFAFQV